MKKWSYLFTALAVVLSDIMCFVAAYNYRGMPSLMAMRFSVCE